VIVDRDTKHTQQFRKVVGDSGTDVIRLPSVSKNLNAYAGRFDRSIKDDCRGRMIFVVQTSLRRAVGEYLAHYNDERN
jgi:putative transposase